jgi:hypothetical protein
MGMNQHLVSIQHPIILEFDESIIKKVLGESSFCEMAA